MLAMLAQARWIVPIVALSLIASGCTSFTQFPATDIVALERRHHDVKKDVGLVLIGVAVIFMIGIAHAYGELLGRWS